MHRRALLLLTSCFLLSLGASAADFDISDYGAKPDGSKCTAACARAIDACAKAGGGRVVVPAGKWLAGAVHLKSNVELHLCEGAEVLFSQDPADYLPAVHSSWEGMECMNYSPLVYAYCCTNVAITGKGTLRAYEGEWKDSVWGRWASGGAAAARRRLYDWSATDHPVGKREIYKMADAHTRPQFVQFNRCKGVRWEGFKVRNSPFWTMHLYLCEDVVVRGIDVVARASNNDGIDIEMTRNVLVERCSFDQGDDTFVLKSGRNRDGWRIGVPTENVEIRDCRIERANSFFCCGSEISSGVRNVWFHDCSVGRATRLCYVKTNRRRGAFVENVRCENIRAKTCSVAVDVNTDVLYEWANFPDYELRTTRIGNLSFKNIHCEAASCRVDIQGDAGLPVDGVVLENVRADTTSVDDRLVNVRNAVEDGKPMRTSEQFSVRDFGGDVQAAVDCAATKGGARVYVPGGEWRTGPLVLRDGVELNLASNARLLFSDDPALYRTAAPQLTTHNSQPTTHNPQPSSSYRPLLSAEGAAHVRISGYGRVEALTEGWRSVPAEKRPPLLSFRNCSRVHVTSVSVRNTPSRALVADGCTGLFVNGVEFIADIAEGDFCSCANCPDAQVRGCSFWIGDGSTTPDYKALRKVKVEGR